MAKVCKFTCMDEREMLFLMPKDICRIHKSRRDNKTIIYGTTNSPVVCPHTTINLTRKLPSYERYNRSV